MPHIDKAGHAVEVVDERNWVEQEDSHDIEREGSLGAVVADETDAHWEREAPDSCTVAARPDLPGLRVVHGHHIALAVADHFDLADRLDLLQGPVRWVHKVPRPERKLPGMTPDGIDIAD